MTAPDKTNKERGTMLAYHNDINIKNDLLAQLQAHYDADEIVKGKYWEGGKGCAVGCTIHSANHEEYELRFGIPEMLARLEDTIFEGLPNDKAKQWPIRFTDAIIAGADLSRVGYKFMYWNLTENLILKDSNDALVQAAIIKCRNVIKQCAEVICPLTKGEIIDKSAAWSAAMSAARSAESAAWSAMSAAWSAAMSAARSAESAAESAAMSAAWSAESAARSAMSAARSAAMSAAWSAMSAAWSAAMSAARSAESAAMSAESAAYERMSDKLIELLKDAV